MSNLHDAEESSDSGRAFDYGLAFRWIYCPRAHLAKVPLLYSPLRGWLYSGPVWKPESVGPVIAFIFCRRAHFRNSPGEIIVSHQTILLKLLDSYLQSSPSQSVFSGMVPMLTTCFFELSIYSGVAIQRAVGSETAGSDGIHGSLDPILPKACEALVLVSQCIASILLVSEPTNSDQIIAWKLFRETTWSDGRVLVEHAVGR